MRWGILTVAAVALAVPASAPAKLPRLAAPALAAPECTTVESGDTSGGTTTTTCTAPPVTLVVVQDVNQSYAGGTHDNVTVAADVDGVGSAECTKVETHPQDTGPATYGAGCEAAGVEAGATLSEELP